MSSQPWEPNLWRYMHSGCLLETKRNEEQPRQKLLLSLTRYTGGSHLSRTVVKPDSCLAQIFCIISFLYNLINLMQISTDKPDN